LKVLIVNVSDSIGGASKAAYRLHKSLLEEGLDSKMLVRNKRTDDPTVVSVPDSKFEDVYFNTLRPFIDQIPVKFYRNRARIPFSVSWVRSKKTVKKINYLNPDIVHLHWINGGFLSLKDLTKINKPIVWSLHDDWAFTGGCHIKWDCEKFMYKCGACPLLGSSSQIDLSRITWFRKKRTFKKIKNLTIVGLSKWITKNSQNSSLLRNKPHINLPNPIDTFFFKPFDKKEARRLLNLPMEKKLILFGAMNVTKDINKGFHKFIEAVRMLSLEHSEIVIYGAGNPIDSINLKLKVHYLGLFFDEVSMVALYNACDVLVVPSLQENLSNTIMESLSCGTPVVAFDTGGNSDLIDHKKNGYLADSYDVRDLAIGIKWILSLPEKDYKKVSQNAREKIIKNYNSKLIAKKYIELYKKIINKKL